MKPFLLFVAAWVLAGLGAIIGSMMGNAAGKSGLFAGAIIGGLIGTGVAVATGSRLRWLPIADRRGAFFGGGAGFLLAAPIAVSNLHTPVTPVLICGLAGVGLLLGVGIARGWRST